jgi:glycine dehydrogenase subunit 1
MALRLTKRNRVVLARTVHPEYRQVVATYVQHQPVEITEAPYARTGQVDLGELEFLVTPDTAAVVVQSPNFFGTLEHVWRIVEVAHRKNALVIVTVTEPLSLAVAEPPTEADIVCGEAQSFGIPVSFGGPGLGFLATKEKFVRQMPGRLVGQTVDSEGRRGFTLTLATREQHIRRERATSNICTNQALCALSATIYLCLMGKGGLKTLAEHNLSKAHYAARQLLTIDGVTAPFSGPYFNEIVVKTRVDAGLLLAELRKEMILGGLHVEAFYPELRNHLLICLTETTQREAIDRMVGVCRRFEASSHLELPVTEDASPVVDRNH